MFCQVSLSGHVRAHLGRSEVVVVVLARGDALDASLTSLAGDSSSYLIWVGPFAPRAPLML